MNVRQNGPIHNISKSVKSLHIRSTGLLFAIQLQKELDMSLVVNHNLMAANVANNLSSHYGNLATSTQRLRQVFGLTLQLMMQQDWPFES